MFPLPYRVLVVGSIIMGMATSAATASLNATMALQGQAIPPDPAVKTENHIYWEGASSDGVILYGSEEKGNDVNGDQYQNVHHNLVRCEANTTPFPVFENTYNRKGWAYKYAGTESQGQWAYDTNLAFTNWHLTKYPQHKQYNNLKELAGDTAYFMVDSELSSQGFLFRCGAGATPIGCGNGFIDDLEYNHITEQLMDIGYIPEECDDGNRENGDGCSSECFLEELGLLCGNGIKDDDEECDDGNNDYGDGCTPDCRIPELPDALLEKVTNAIPQDVDRTAVPTGLYPAGEFEFTAFGEKSEEENGPFVRIDRIKAEIYAKNVQLEESFSVSDLNNECDITEKVSETIDTTGIPFDITVYTVECKSIDGSTRSNIPLGTSAEFALYVNIINPNVQVANPSALQVTLLNTEVFYEGYIRDQDTLLPATWYGDVICGDTLVEHDEECDDGNRDNGDGCSSTCKREIDLCEAIECAPGFMCIEGECVQEEDNSCYSHDDCDVDGGEFCSIISNENPTGDCLPPPTCAADGFCPSVCTGICELPVCGDGIVHFAEECDDGNTQNGDGCSNECAFEEEVTLDIAVKYIGQTGTAVENQKQIELLKFDAYAQKGHALLTSAAFEIEEGYPGDVSNYTLQVKTDNGDLILEDGIAATSDGLVQFNNLAGGGYVTPEDVVVTFTVLGDVSSSITHSNFRMRIAEFLAPAIGAEVLEDGSAINGIAIDDECKKDQCNINIATVESKTWIFSNTSDLYVTEETTLKRPQHIIGGFQGRDPSLSLEFVADGGEAVEVTDIQIVKQGKNAGLDRLVLHIHGKEETITTNATVAGCGSDVVLPDTYCANMENRQLVVPAGEEVHVDVYAVARADTAGGVSGEMFSLFIPEAFFDEENNVYSPIRARGTTSSNDLLGNYGEHEAGNGTVFIGTHVAAENTTIVSEVQRILMADIEQITSPPSDVPAPGNDYPHVPSGIGEIARFSIQAVEHRNDKNGSDDVVMKYLMLDGYARHVDINTKSFELVNQEDRTRKASCMVVDTKGGEVVSELVPENFHVICNNIEGTIPAEIDEGESAQFELYADIKEPNTSTTEYSQLQISLTKFTLSDEHTMGEWDRTHLIFNAQDAVSNVSVDKVDQAENVVNGTLFSSPPMEEAICGDGKVAPTENCDDGNTENQDGCSKNCNVEPGFICEGSPSVCNIAIPTPNQCSDIPINCFIGEAECCSNGEWACTDGWTGESQCPHDEDSVCGNGLIEKGEQCDDGNVASGDGCSAQCTIEQESQPESIAIQRGHFFYRDTNGDWVYNKKDASATHFGNPGDIALVGDTDGDGLDDDLVIKRGKAIYRDTNGDWLYTEEDAPPTFVGLPTDTMYLGDVDGDGDDDLILRRGHIFYRDTNDNWQIDDNDPSATNYGNPGETVFITDTDGDGDEEIVLKRGNRYYRDTNNDWLSTEADAPSTTIGNPGDVAMVADLNGNGNHTVVLKRGNKFYRDTNGDWLYNSLDAPPTFVGLTTDDAFIADSDGDGKDNLVIKRNKEGQALYYRDTNGDWNYDHNDAPPTFYGKASDTLLIGNWNK